MDWIGVAQDRGWWSDLVNKVINLRGNLRWEVLE
jgi:hypothetical protein